MRQAVDWVSTGHSQGALVVNIQCWASSRDELQLCHTLQVYTCNMHGASNPERIFTPCVLKRLQVQFYTDHGTAGPRVLCRILCWGSAVQQQSSTLGTTQQRPQGGGFLTRSQLRHPPPDFGGTVRAHICRARWSLWRGTALPLLLPTHCQALYLSPSKPQTADQSQLAKHDG